MNTGDEILTLITLLGLILYQIVSAIRARTVQTTLGHELKQHVSEQVNKLQGKVDNVETRVQQSIAPTAQKAEDAASTAREAIDLMRSISSAWMPLVEAQKAMITRSEAAIKMLTDKVDDLEQANRDKDRRIETYMETVDHLIRDYEQLKVQLKERDEASKQRDNKLEHLESQVQDMDSSLNSTKSDLESIRAEYEKTKQQLEQAQKDLEAANARIKALEQERDQERTAAKAEKERLTSELEGEREKVRELQKQVKELETQVSNLKAELEAQKPKETKET